MWNKASNCYIEQFTKKANAAANEHFVFDISESAKGK